MRDRKFTKTSTRSPIQEHWPSHRLLVDSKFQLALGNSYFTMPWKSLTSKEKGHAQAIYINHAYESSRKTIAFFKSGGRRSSGGHQGRKATERKVSNTASSCLSKSTQEEAEIHMGWAIWVQKKTYLITNMKRPPKASERTTRTEGPSETELPKLRRAQTKAQLEFEHAHTGALFHDRVEMKLW